MKASTFLADRISGLFRVLYVNFPDFRKRDLAKSGSEKSGCRGFAVINDDLSTASLDVPGVEVLEEIPDGAKEDIGPFYADQLDILRRRAKQLQNRESHFVAKKGLTFWIYRRP